MHYTFGVRHFKLQSSPGYVLDSTSVLFRRRLKFEVPDPRGLVLIVVMVCLVVFTMLGGVLLKLALTEQRQSRLREARLQAEWLAESAIERAAARLTQSAEYTGETWNVSADHLGDGAAGIVTIEVDPVEARANLRHVRVRVEYQRDGVRSTRQSKVVSVEIKHSSSETGS